jgi:hypothetical protein
MSALAATHGSTSPSAAPVSSLISAARDAVSSLLVARGEQSARLEHPEQEAPERGQEGLAGRPFADGVEQVGLERLHARVEQIFLRGEVVENGAFGDIGFSGDLGDRDRVEATVDEEAPGGVGDQLPRLLLLSLAQPRLGG